MGRQLIYAADFDAMNALVGYLTDNCCSGAGGCTPAAAPKKPGGRRKATRAA